MEITALLLAGLRGITAKMSRKRVIQKNDLIVMPHHVLGQSYHNILAHCSSKRSLFREQEKSCEEANNVSDIKDVDSDLGPMSPLVLTDQSSCDSSPGRHFVSPLPTPEKLPLIPLTNWSRELTRNCCPVISVSDDMNDDDVVPETPCKITKEHQQLQTQFQAIRENRMITPIGSQCNNAAVPKLHRRKSVGMTGNQPLDECTSPEIKKCSFKRCLLDDSVRFSSSKTEKSDQVLMAVPRARAALFRDSKLKVEGIKNNKAEGPAFTLTAKSFYKSNNETLRKYDFLGWREPVQQQAKKINKRKISPTSHLSYRKSAKKHKGGEINCGVWHAVKKPKFKRQTLQNKLTQLTDKQTKIDQVVKSKVHKENLFLKTNVDNTKPSYKDVNDKKKLNQFTLAQNAISIKDKDSDHLYNERKLERILFDTTDLTVDDPNIEESLKQSKVNNILKVLEDDWTDNVYNDARESAYNLSPRTSYQDKSNTITRNTCMSPGSELSNMTSSMNIEDLPASVENQNNNEMEKKFSSTTEKMTVTDLHPLFSKKILSEAYTVQNVSRKRKRNTFSWLLSSKQNCTDNQYQIDAGQKNFGATQCKECGIVYYVGDPNDENAHLNYHNSYKTLKFQGWKNERVVYADTYSSSRIVLVESKDSNSYWKKVNEILEIVDQDLGLPDTKLSCYRDKRVYMYIRDKTILGILVAESAEKAFRMIPELSELNCCTSETCAVKCGINVVWTALSHRRQGIATKLVDTLRATFYYGYMMSLEDFAFSAPTPSGKKFAENYTKTSQFKVY